MLLHRRRPILSVTVLVDAHDSILAASGKPEGPFAGLFDERRLDASVAATAKRLTGGGIAVIRNKITMHVALLKGPPAELRAITFEPLQYRRDP
jgi:hypothetical protein